MRGVGFRGPLLRIIYAQFKRSFGEDCPVWANVCSGCGEPLPSRLPRCAQCGGTEREPKELDEDEYPWLDEAERRCIYVQRLAQPLTRERVDQKCRHCQYFPTKPMQNVPFEPTINWALDEYHYLKTCADLGLHVDPGIYSVHQWAMIDAVHTATMIVEGRIRQEETEKLKAEQEKARQTHGR